jgi:hypothetical protein
MTTESTSADDATRRDGSRLSEGLGAVAEASKPPQGYFSRSLLESALMTPEQEAFVRKGACPKCFERLARSSEGGGVLFRQCIGCGDIWVTEAPNCAVNRRPHE